VSVDSPEALSAGVTSRSTSALTTLELFAGAGGLALGFHQAGFEILDLIERDSACCATLRANADYLGWKDPGQLEARDVTSMDFGVYHGKVGVLTAGAPCQPFSRGGRRRGRYDERNMLPEVVRAVAQSLPKAFVIENVRGLLFGDAIGYLRSIVARLRNPTEEDPTLRVAEDLFHLQALEPSDADMYRVEYRLLDSADFGLAQHRPRLFIVGVRTDQPAFSWPTSTNSRASLVEDLRGEAYWLDHPDVSAAAIERARERLAMKPLQRKGDRWRTLRDLTEALGIPATRADVAKDPSHVLVPGARLYGKHTGSRIDWAAKTIKAGVHGSPGGEHILLTSPKRFRYLTIRECAVLQGFPLDYRLPEKRTPAMRQLGNAVAVDVARALALRLRATIAACDKD
jgi:DNA (cytosine-5)-methyltransferase 1